MSISSKHEPSFYQFRRVEFLGDKLIDCILADYYMERHVSRKVASVLIQKGVSNKVLAEAARECGLTRPYKHTQPTKDLGSMFEYAVARVFTEHGYKSAKGYVRKWLVPVIKSRFPIEEFELWSK